ncbi:DUF3800 domain-containing protein [Bradyrhizobium sp. HKCCYLRH2015]|uniref:DUF3800 domain-containing protein n=1 Tax=Bradyrhizobium sp. HKCCYLRH2015 TaxID=3420742 RepID=UPI003EBE2CC0
MPVTFVAYIDESGDTGLNRVKPDSPDGATEWLILSAFLVSSANDSNLVSWVKDVQEGIKSKRRDLHFNKLLPFKKSMVCAALAQKDARCFSVMSNKQNIERYKNKNLGEEKAWLYWWLTRLLLERVTDFCERLTPIKQRGQDKLRIVFSRRGGLTYENFKSYLELLRYQSVNGKLRLKAGDIKWSMIDLNEVLVMDHHHRAGLQLSDVIAGAFYEAVERNRGDIEHCEPAYAKQLEPLVAKSAKNNALGYGIKTMPNLWKMDLQDQQKAIFEHFGYSPRGWKSG